VFEEIGQRVKKDRANSRQAQTKEGMRVKPPSQIIRAHEIENLTSLKRGGANVFGKRQKRRGDVL